MATDGFDTLLSRQSNRRGGGDFFLKGKGNFLEDFSSFFPRRFCMTRSQCTIKSPKAPSRRKKMVDPQSVSRLGKDEKELIRPSENGGDGGCQTGLSVTVYLS